MAIDIESTRKIPQFVRVIIQNERKEFLIMKSKYLSCASWNFPGGKVEKGEQPSVTAVREIFEETNLIINDPKKLANFDIEIAEQLWCCYIFFTKDYTNNLFNKEPDKCSELEFMSFAEITELEDLSSVTVRILDDFL